MKRKQKRYESAEEIEQMIEDTKNTKTLECARAESCDAEIESLKKWMAQYPTPWESAHAKLPDKVRQDYSENTLKIKERRKESDRLRKHQGALATRLVILKEKLAAFNTEPMPFLTDRSVV